MIQTDQLPNGGTLVPFSPHHAETIVRWVLSDDDLIRVAPQSDWPLTPDKVLSWIRPGGRAFVWLAGDAPGDAALRASASHARQVSTAQRIADQSTAAGAVVPKGQIQAYGEVNPLGRDRGVWWLGHVIVGPEFRGLGRGRRFVRALVDVAIHHLAAERVALIVFPDNAHAIRCYRSVGFREVCEEPHKFRPDGGAQTMLRMELDRRDLLDPAQAPSAAD